MRLGVLGGMGPLATADFFKKVIQMTNASKDQEHIHVLIDNNTEIPDRTGYILNQGEDPRRELIRSAIKLEMMGADLIAIPCNTAHYFYKDIVAYTDVPVLNMVQETASFLKKEWPDKKRFLLLATTGTYEAGVYRSIFEKEGLELVIPDTKGQEQVMNWIYQVKAGTLNLSRRGFEAFLKKYTLGEEMPVILGCTELPVLVQQLEFNGEVVDPTSVLAKKCVASLKSVSVPVPTWKNAG